MSEFLSVWVNLVAFEHGDLDVASRSARVSRLKNGETHFKVSDGFNQKVFVWDMRHVVLE